MSDKFFWILFISTLGNALLLVFILMRSWDLRGIARELRDELRAAREEASRAARESREELAKGIRGANETLSGALATIGDVQRAQLDGVSRQLKDLTETYQGSLARIRESIAVGLKDAQETNERKLEDVRRTVNDNLHEHGKELANGLMLANETVSKTLASMGEIHRTHLDGLATRLNALSESNVGSLERIRTGVDSRINELQTSNAKNLDDMRKTIDEKLADNRYELSRGLKAANDMLATTLKSIGESQLTQREDMTRQLNDLADSNRVVLEQIRITIDSRVNELQASNEKKLDEMRRTVDEKLHNTLERRLGESFQLVGERLEAVQRGLGEMQSLANGVGDLKRVLTNVKARGTWAEVQLGALLEQTLAAGQFERNVRTKDDSREAVEYAIRLPGRQSDLNGAVWLPIDSKFPQEDYLRLQDAAEKGGPEAVQKAAEILARTIRAAGQEIRDKHINPPQTTDFAIMFLATEGLYAEVVRQPALMEELQQRCRIVVAGPTTLTALLSSLRMGFQTLAIEQRAAEVWKVLGAVKSEFGKFGDVLEKVKRQLNTAARSIDETGVRSRAMERRLRSVEQLPEAEASRLLELPAEMDEPEDAEETDQGLATEPDDASSS
jgi:DNA recombination protein RmuC